MVYTSELHMENTAVYYFALNVFFVFWGRGVVFMLRTLATCTHDHSLNLERNFRRDKSL